MVKLSRNKSWKLGGGMECWASILTSMFGSSTASELSDLRAGRPHFTSEEIPWYSFLLEAEWTSGLLNSDWTNRSLEKFQRTPPGIEPGTSVAQCLNQLRHRLLLDKNIYDYIWNWECIILPMEQKLAELIYIYFGGLKNKIMCRVRPAGHWWGTSDVQWPGTISLTEE